jgi:hypothetical protein
MVDSIRRYRARMLVQIAEPIGRLPALQVPVVAFADLVVVPKHTFAIDELRDFRQLTCQRFSRRLRLVLPPREGALPLRR